MDTAGLAFVDMPRRPSDEDTGKPKLPTDIVRVPVRMTRAQRDKLQEMAFFWHRIAIEILGGEWLVERIEAEHKKGKPKPPK